MSCDFPLGPARNRARFGLGRARRRRQRRRGGDPILRVQTARARLCQRRKSLQYHPASRVRRDPWQVVYSYFSDSRGDRSLLLGASTCADGRCRSILAWVACTGVSHMKDDFVPLKRVAAEIGVSRATLWRASKCSIPGFPSPHIARGRVFWRIADLPALEAALDSFQGRSAFERGRRHAKACKALAQVVATRTKKARRGTQVATDLRQPDLFDGPEMSAPSSVEIGGSQR